MGDDAHQAVALGEGEQGLHGLVQGLVVQGAEALVHKHGIQPDASRAGLDHVAQTQGQGQGGQEGFAAGQALDAALAAVAVVDDIQLQAALALAVLRLGAALQLVLAVGHHRQAQVGPTDDLLKIGGLDIGLQAELGLAPDGAARGIGQGAHPGIAAFQGRQRRQLAAQAGKGGGVGGNAAVGAFLLCQLFPALGLGLGLGVQIRLDIDFRRVLQLLAQLLGGGAGAQHRVALLPQGLPGLLRRPAEQLQPLPLFLQRLPGVPRRGEAQREGGGLGSGGFPAGAEGASVRRQGGDGFVQRFQRLAGGGDGPLRFRQPGAARCLRLDLPGQVLQFSADLLDFLGQPGFLHPGLLQSGLQLLPGSRAGGAQGGADFAFAL